MKLTYEDVRSNSELLQRMLREARRERARAIGRLVSQALRAVAERLPNRNRLPRGSVMG